MGTLQREKVSPHLVGWLLQPGGTGTGRREVAPGLQASAPGLRVPLTPGPQPRKGSGIFQKLQPACGNISLLMKLTFLPPCVLAIAPFLLNRTGQLNWAGLDPFPQNSPNKPHNTGVAEQESGSSSRDDRWAGLPRRWRILSTCTSSLLDTMSGHQTCFKGSVETWKRSNDCTQPAKSSPRRCTEVGRAQVSAGSYWILEKLRE